NARSRGTPWRSRSMAMPRALPVPLGAKWYTWPAARRSTPLSTSSHQSWPARASALLRSATSIVLRTRYVASRPSFHGSCGSRPSLRRVHARARERSAEDFVGLDAQLLECAVAVHALAEVDLRDGVDAVCRRDVDQQCEVHAVGRHERDRFERPATSGALAGQ